MKPPIVTGRSFASAALIAFALVNSWFIYNSLLPHFQPTPPFPDLSSDTYTTKTLPGDNIKSATPPLQINKTSVIPPGVRDCDLFVGKWVPVERQPLYTNETCKFIHPSQNCMMNGRPDRGYLNWKWKPSTCELASLDPVEFLHFMRTKRMVFIGDSIARNHMQSLLCALAQVEEPVVYVDSRERDLRWGFTSHNFTLDYLWSPFLAQHEFDNETYHVHLDVPEDAWRTQINDYDVAVLSTGYWYFRPTIYYMNNTILGCNPRSHLNYTIIQVRPAYRLAHHNMLKFMLEGFQGITFLRTLTVDHFEHGSWNTGGLCNRTGPYSGTEASELPYMSNEMYRIQVEEYRKAVEGGGAEGWRLKLLNVSWSAFMRPDGHPNTYRIQPANEMPQNDCLHWCLPGPIDTWNEFLWHTLRQLELKSGAGSGSPRLMQFSKLGRT